MNTGIDRTVALAHASANSKADKKPRYVHFWEGVYWVEHNPPGTSWAGVFPENVDVVQPDGTTSTLAAYRGANDADRQTDPA